jgi:hypothetical protein
MTEQNPTAYEHAKAVRQAHEKELLAKANVVGVGVGLRQRGGELTDVVAIVVMVRQKVPPAQLSQEDIIPGEIEGVPVDVQGVGVFRAQ